VAISGQQKTRVPFPLTLLADTSNATAHPTCIVLLSIKPVYFRLLCIFAFEVGLIRIPIGDEDWFRLLWNEYMIRHLSHELNKEIDKLHFTNPDSSNQGRCRQSAEPQV
jgi:hypothetical protein